MPKPDLFCAAIWEKPHSCHKFTVHLADSLTVVYAYGPGFFWVIGPRPGEEGRKVPMVYNSKTIHGIEMKFGRVVENHKLIDLV